MPLCATADGTGGQILLLTNLTTGLEKNFVLNSLVKIVSGSGYMNIVFGFAVVFFFSRNLEVWEVEKSNHLKR